MQTIGIIANVNPAAAKFCTGMRTAIQNSTEFSALTGQILIRGPRATKSVKKTFKKNYIIDSSKITLKDQGSGQNFRRKAECSTPKSTIYSISIIILFPIKTASWAFAHSRTATQ